MKYIRMFEEPNISLVKHKTTELTNCVNCSAILKHDECEYCGTRYSGKTVNKSMTELEQDFMAFHGIDIKKELDHKLSQSSEYVDYIANQLDPDRNKIRI